MDGLKFLVRIELPTDLALKKLESATQGPSVNLKSNLAVLIQASKAPFMGTIKEGLVKITLSEEIKNRVIYRKNQAVFVGKMIDGNLIGIIRPPMFNIIFPILWFLFAGGVFLLYLSRSDFKIWLLSILGLTAILPFVFVVPFFILEAKELRTKIAQVLSSTN